MICLLIAVILSDIANVKLKINTLVDLKIFEWCNKFIDILDVSNDLTDDTDKLLIILIYLCFFTKYLIKCTYFSAYDFTNVDICFI